MIAVVADDLTGAAELGGLGLRYGLRVEIDTVVNPDSRADLLIIATDTRSKSRQAAAQEMGQVTKQLAALNPRLIFKKVDSVLRGHILPEIRAQLAALQLDKALIVPANPALGRTVSDGTYLFEGKPIHLSSFSQDPEFAITSSRVLDMLKANGTPVQVHKNQDTLRTQGIVIGEAQSKADLDAWAARLDPGTLAAGGSGFFRAILDTLALPGVKQVATKPISFGEPVLYVCGTTFGKNREAVQKLKEADGPVSYMPAAIVSATDPASAHYDGWSQEILQCLHTHGKAVVSIDPTTTQTASASAESLREKTAQVVKIVLNQHPVQELLLEGGSTASAVLRQLDLLRFFPVAEMAPGVIRMRVDGQQDLCLTLKPGSYAWPSPLWEFDSVQL